MGGIKMAEQAKASHIKPGEAEKEHRVRHQEVQPSFDKFHGWDQGPLPLTETPFLPIMDKHAALLRAAHSDEGRANLALHLQQTYGNMYVQRLLNSRMVQAKLTVSAPGDIYEQEADRVADAVIRAENAQAQRQEEEEEEIQAKPILQRQEEEEEIQAKSIFQRQEEEEEEELLQGKLDIERQVPEEEELLQGQSAENEGLSVSNDLETRINSARGGGQLLADNVKTKMEGAFGNDFSGVLVHTDSEADTLNQHLSAKAFTTGKDIFFRDGEYSPSSDSGKKLIAHELTHVVQQTARPLINRDRSLTSILPTSKQVAHPRTVKAVASYLRLGHPHKFYQSMVCRPATNRQSAKCLYRTKMKIIQKSPRVIQRAKVGRRSLSMFGTKTKPLGLGRGKKQAGWYHQHIRFDDTWTLPKVGLKNNIGFGGHGLFEEDVDSMAYDYTIENIKDRKALYSAWWVSQNLNFSPTDYSMLQWRGNPNCQVFVKEVMDRLENQEVQAAGEALWQEHASKEEVFRPSPQIPR
jgi:hypothetical protein